MDVNDVFNALFSNLLRLERRLIADRLRYEQKVKNIDVEIEAVKAQILKANKFKLMFNEFNPDSENV